MLTVKWTVLHIKNLGGNNMCESNRKFDMEGERKVKKFLIEHFYKKIDPKQILEGCCGYRAVWKKESQLEGKDTILRFTDPRKHIYIDEKCALTYINKYLRTFAFEIIEKNKYGKYQDGWLIDENKKTDYYAICWLKGKTLYDENGLELKGYNDDNNKEIYKYIERMKPSDLTRVEMFLIKKEKLLSVLENEYHLTKKTMRDNAYKFVKEMQGKKDKGPKNIPNNDKMFYYYTGSKAEQPVNLVIKRSLLKKIAKDIFIITPDNIERPLYCKTCGRKLDLLNSEYGEFYGCRNYRDHEHINTYNIDDD